MIKLKLKLRQDDIDSISVHGLKDKVAIDTCDGWDEVSIFVTKEEALQLAAALVSAAKEIE